MCYPNRIAAPNVGLGVAKMVRALYRKTLATVVVARSTVLWRGADATEPGGPGAVSLQRGAGDPGI
jgi:hypothetical protein